jgi:membrane protein YdbS with pleckstrin-like domain
MAQKTEAGAVRINEEFRPSPYYKRYLYASFILVFIVGILSWYLPMLIFADPYVSLVAGIIILPFLVIWVIWIPLYYASVKYRLTDDEILWNRGVWFRATGIVPYGRITNIDIVQGPLMRFLLIYTLKIQTAGYSGQAASEIKIEGLIEPEPVRQMIRARVRGMTADGTGSAAEGTQFEEAVLSELVRIRELLERT